MSVGCTNCNSTTSTSIISSNMIVVVDCSRVLSTLYSLETTSSIRMSLETNVMTKISSIVQSVYNLWSKLLKWVLNALHDTMTQQKASCLVHNMYTNVSTSCGAICKRFIEDTVMFIWYAFICPCYLPHCFTQLNWRSLIRHLRCFGIKRRRLL